MAQLETWQLSGREVRIRRNTWAFWITLKMSRGTTKRGSLFRSNNLKSIISIKGAKESLLQIKSITWGRWSASSKPLLPSNKPPPLVSRQDWSARKRCLKNCLTSQMRRRKQYSVTMEVLIRIKNKNNPLAWRSCCAQLTPEKEIKLTLMAISMVSIRKMTRPC